MKNRSLRSNERTNTIPKSYMADYVYLLRHLYPTSCNATIPKSQGIPASRSAPKRSIFSSIFPHLHWCLVSLAPEREKSLSQSLQPPPWTAGPNHVPNVLVSFRLAPDIPWIPWRLLPTRGDISWSFELCIS